MTFIIILRHSCSRDAHDARYRTRTPLYLCKSCKYLMKNLNIFYVNDVTRVPIYTLYNMMQLLGTVWRVDYGSNLYGTFYVHVQAQFCARTKPRVAALQQRFDAVSARWISYDNIDAYNMLAECERIRRRLVVGASSFFFSYVQLYSIIHRTGAIWLPTGPFPESLWHYHHQNLYTCCIHVYIHIHMSVFSAQKLLFLSFVSWLVRVKLKTLGLPAEQVCARASGRREATSHLNF